MVMSIVASMRDIRTGLTQKVKERMHENKCSVCKHCVQGMGIGANAMHVLTPRLNTYLSLQLGWGFSVALGVWTCFGVTGQLHLSLLFKHSVCLIVSHRAYTTTAIKLL